MKAEDIKVARDYAYIDPDHPNDPLRAVAIEEPENGVVHVVVHHPDAGPFEDHVATRTLHSSWASTPDQKRWKAVVDELRKAGSTTTWDDVVAVRHGAVRRQRALADRLHRIAGIRREHLHYAGRGGGSNNRHDGLLQLNYDELEELISRAENGPGYLPRGVAPGPEIDPESEAALVEEPATP